MRARWRKCTGEPGIYLLKGVELEWPIREIERDQEREQAIDRKRKVRDTRRIEGPMSTYRGPWFESV